VRITRRKALFGLAAGAAAAAYPTLIEPRWLDLTHRQAKLSGLRSPVRILHMSDLHSSFFVPMSMIEHAVTVGLSAKPDLICVTGDFITSGADFLSKEYIAALKRLSTAAPTYAVLGNHDGGPWTEALDGRSDHKDVDRLLEESGIELLHNRSKIIAVRDSTLSLVGTGDLWNQELDAHQAFSEVGPDPVVLLSHNPDGKDFVANYPWQLMLSGHTHGGQVIIPFVGPHYAPVQDKRYVDGLRPWGTRQIQVSRGVGNVLGVRFGCRPEITLLELVS
jgi:predicted MPP superfamily phosphohydrolase